MSKDRPLVIPFWSTDASYPAGADPWSATPTRVDPGAGMQAAGLTPGQPFPAPHANWLYGNVGDWLTYLADIQVANWFVAASGVANMSAWCIGFNPFSQEFLIGHNINKKVNKAKAPTLCTWATATLPTGEDVGVTGIADDGATLNCIITAESAGFGVYTYDGVSGTYTYQGQMGDADADSGGSVMWDANASKWVAIIHERVLGNVSLGAAYTSADAATWDGPFEIDFAGAPNILLEGLANDGAGTLVVLAFNDIDDTAQSYVSSDGGETWTKYLDIFNGAMPAQPTSPGALAWDAGRGLFVALAATEKVWTSADGATWTETATIPDGAINYTIAVSGPYWLVTRAKAITYSADAGATWRNVTNLLAGGSNGTLIAAGGGVFAAVDISDDDVIRSLAV